MDLISQKYNQLKGKLLQNSGRMSVKGKIRLLTEIKELASQQGLEFSKRYESILIKLNAELNQPKRELIIKYPDSKVASSIKKIDLQDKINSFSFMEKEELREFLIDQLHCDLVKICNILGSAACKDSK